MKPNVPLCNARLFEGELSFHITITDRRNVILNAVYVSNIEKDETPTEIVMSPITHLMIP